MKKNKGNKSFTLIELLVVVSIIVLLISIVLVAVTSARNKAKNKAIMQELAHIRTVAEMIFTDENIGGSYDELCDAGTLNDNSSYYPVLKDLETRIEELNPGNDKVVCWSTGGAYCVQTSLNGGGHFCIDSTGIASTVSVFCDQTTADCASDQPELLEKMSLEAGDDPAFILRSKA